MVLRECKRILALYGFAQGLRIDKVEVSRNGDGRWMMVLMDGNR